VDKSITTGDMKLVDWYSGIIRLYSYTLKL
jgi:hypothetical protein